MRGWLCIVLASVACGGASNREGGSSARTGTAPIASSDHGAGVSLTGEGAYGDRHDPSGWSGVSTNPSAVGGGPPPVGSSPPATSAKPAASAPPVVTPPAAPTAPAMPPSKELDTAPPAKDLQF